MSVLQTIPTTNISWDDVRDTLNSHQGSVTNEFRTAFLDTANINWRARFKPVPYPMDFPKDDKDNGEKWWCAKIVDDPFNSGRCGVDFPVYTSTSSLVGITDPASLWKPKLPQGGVAQPYRMDDFGGYDPYAADIINEARRQPDLDGTILIGQSTPTNIKVKFNENHGTSALDYTEIGYMASNSKMLNNLYYGLVAISENGSYHCVQTMNNTIEEVHNTTSGDYKSATDHDMFMILDRNFITNSGQYKMYPCLFVSNEGILSSETPIAVANGYIPLPVEPIVIKFAHIGGLFNLNSLDASIPNRYGGWLTVDFLLFNYWENDITVSPNLAIKMKVIASAYSGNASEAQDKRNHEEVINKEISCASNGRVRVTYETSFHVNYGENVDVQIILTYNDMEQVSQVGISNYTPEIQ